MTNPPVVIFHSKNHPGESGRSATYARFLMRPLAFCNIPVMLLTLVAALQGAWLWPYLLWGFPGAFAVAMLWTSFRVRTAVAEVHIAPGAAALRTVWEATQAGTPLSWLPIFEIRRTRTAADLALGDVTHELHFADWEEPEELLRALRAARDY